MWIATMILTFMQNKIFSSNFCFKLKNTILLTKTNVISFKGCCSCGKLEYSKTYKHINTEQNLKEEIFW